jgi:copper homeostasis protein
VAAERGGAHRVELCANLLEGGVTPSVGLIAEVRRRVSIKLHIMVRPRGGDFCYTDDEIAIMRRDITVAKELGADGVVFGILDAEGTVDAKRTRELADIARPLKVTYHRAIDMSRNLLWSLETLIDLRIDYVLTSGGEQIAIEGKETLRRLVRAAEGRIVVIAGSGIQEHNVRQLLEETGVQEIHVGLNAPVPGPMRYRNEKISMGTVKGREHQRFGVSQERVGKLVAAASEFEDARLRQG